MAVITGNPQAGTAETPQSSTRVADRNIITEPTRTIQVERVSISEEQKSSVTSALRAGMVRLLVHAALDPLVHPQPDVRRMTAGCRPLTAGSGSPGVRYGATGEACAESPARREGAIAVISALGAEDGWGSPAAGPAAVVATQVPTGIGHGRPLIQLIEHQIDHHASHRHVHPEGKGPAGDRDVAVVLRSPGSRLSVTMAIGRMVAASSTWLMRIAK